MKVFVIDFSDGRIYRDEFEIVQLYRHVRRLEPLREWALTSFDEIGDGSNFFFNSVLAGKFVSGDQARKVQQKLSTEGQRIYATLARALENGFLTVAYK